MRFTESVKLFDAGEIRTYMESEEKISWSVVNYRHYSKLYSIADMTVHIHVTGAYTVCNQDLSGGPWRCHQPFHGIETAPQNLTLRGSSHTRYHRMVVIGITCESKERIRTAIVDIYDK